MVKFKVAMELEAKIQFVKGVGPKKASLLEKELGIITVSDLLEYFPFRFEDRSKFYKVKDINIYHSNSNIQLVGEFTGKFELITKGRKRLTAEFVDDTGAVKIVWFQGFEWIKKTYKPGKKYLLFGKPKIFGNEVSFVHPELEVFNNNNLILKNNILPVYPLKENLKKNFVTNKIFRKIIAEILPQVYDKIPENLPLWLINKYKLLSRRDAIKNMHLPANMQMLDKAIARLKFEELFFVQLKIQQRRFKRKEKDNGFVFEKVGDLFNAFYNKYLPFELTNAQKRVIKEIRKDLKSGRQMNRLLQGDVGSGKTLVALMSMLLALDNGFQAALMAPTEVLAQQHYYSLKEMVGDLPVKISLLTGSTTAKNKREIKKQLSDGEIDIIIGTHALIEDDVVFKNLGLVVIDEQHRFGVAQRAKMWQKNELPPHVLVMTATPIPRTLAMTLYGDLAV